MFESQTVGERSYGSSYQPAPCQHKSNFSEDVWDVGKRKVTKYIDINHRMHWIKISNKNKNEGEIMPMYVLGIGCETVEVKDIRESREHQNNVAEKLQAYETKINGILAR